MITNQPTMTDKLDLDFIDEIAFNMYLDSGYNEAEVIDTYRELSGDDYADAVMRDMTM